MTENMEKFNDKLTKDDEEFVVCQICFINFNEKEHVPKYLKCHHFFCLSCIKRLTGPKENVISCPTCRSQSVLSPRKCEELFTNRLALRLLKVVEGVQESAEKEEKQRQQWCSVCAFPAYVGCHETQHEIQDSTQFYNARTLLLKSIVNKTNYLCNETIKGCHKIESAHQVLLAWIKWLQQEIVQSAASNTATIAQLESLITEEIGAHILQEENMYATINNINQLIAKCSDRCQVAEKAELKTRNFLSAYCSAHQESARFFEPEQFSADGSPPDLISWLKRLNTFDAGVTSNQANKRCVNVLAFFISLLSGEQLQSKVSPLDYVAASMDFDSNTDITIIAEKYHTDITSEPRPSCSGTYRLAKRHAEDESGSSTSAYKRERGSVLTRHENAWAMNNSTKPEGYGYHYPTRMNAQQELGQASPSIGTYTNSAHENLFVSHGTARTGSAITQDIPYLAEMDTQQVSLYQTSSRSQISGQNKFEIQGFRTGMHTLKSPEARTMRLSPSSLPLNLAVNNVAPAAPISSVGRWIGENNAEAVHIRTENTPDWLWNGPLG